MNDPKSRRQILLNEMDSLNRSGINCFDCPGHCCTSLANSMMITATETSDIVTYLKKSGRFTEELKVRLADTIKKFRLDVPMPGNGRRSFLRRTYDCPFFEGKSLGCSLPKEVKPYGCLGFNPTEPGETEGKSCSSNQLLLAKREDEFPEDVSNKLPLPVALLAEFSPAR